MCAQIAISLILFFMSILTQGCDKIEPGNIARSPASTSKLAVAEVQVTRQPVIYEAMGTIRARMSSVIGSKLMGTVSKILVDEGQKVSSSELLIVLDRRQVSAQQRQSEAALAEARKAEEATRSALASARAGAELAQTNFSRYTEMFKDEAVTQREVDAAVAGHRQAQAALRQAKAMAAAAHNRVEKARASVIAAEIASGDASIEAPYDGIITAKMVDVGDLASPGMPLLKIEQTRGYRVDVELPETYLQSVQATQSVSIHVPAADGLPINGIIETIVPAADEKSRTFLVKVRLPDTPRITSGMFARVSIPVGKTDMILLPMTAIIKEGQLTGVYTVDTSQISRFRLLRTGRTIGKSVEVLSGLMEGTRYVVSPPPGFTDGIKVESAS
jgi:RND family efflux transporter MFP subunit